MKHPALTQACSFGWIIPYILTRTYDMKIAYILASSADSDEMPHHH